MIFIILFILYTFTRLCRPVKTTSKSQDEEQESFSNEVETNTTIEETKPSTTIETNTKSETDTETETTKPSEIECQTEGFVTQAMEVQTDSTKSVENETQTVTSSATTSEMEIQTEVINLTESEVQTDSNPEVDERDATIARLLAENEKLKTSMRMNEELVQAHVARIVECYDETISKQAVEIEQLQRKARAYKRELASYLEKERSARASSSTSVHSKPGILKMPQAPPRSAPTPSEEPYQRIVENVTSKSSQTVLGVVPDWSYCNKKEVEEESQVVDSPLDSSSGYYGNLPTEIVYSNTPAKRVYQVMLEYEKIDMKEKESP